MALTSAHPINMSIYCREIELKKTQAGNAKLVLVLLVAMLVLSIGSIAIIVKTVI